MTRLPTRPAALAPAPPVMSGWLREAVARAMQPPHPDIGTEPPEVPLPVRDEAARVLPRWNDLLRPATAEDWARFLRPLAFLPGGPADEREVTAAGAMMAFAMPELPGSLLTAARQSEALRRFAFWPKPVELDQWLAPEAAPLRATRRAVQAVAASTGSRTPRGEGPPTPEVQAEVRAKVEALQHYLAARRGAQEQEAPAGRPLHPRELLRAWEKAAADGVGMAAVRASVLRRAMGLTPDDPA